MADTPGPHPVAPITCHCDPALPSGTSAYKMMSGDLSAAPEALLHMGLRGGLIAAGMYAAGLRGKDLTKYALAGTAAIEVFVLTWAAWKGAQNRAATP